MNSGVDLLSMGALIHKAVWVDMSLQLYPVS
jgi:nicotinate-nucleotide pyrophosphorylase